MLFLNQPKKCQGKHWCADLSKEQEISIPYQPIVRSFLKLYNFALDQTLSPKHYLLAACPVLQEPVCDLLFGFWMCAQRVCHCSADAQQLASGGSGTVSLSLASKLPLALILGEWLCSAPAFLFCLQWAHLSWVWSAHRWSQKRAKKGRRMGELFLTQANGTSAPQAWLGLRLRPAIPLSCLDNGFSAGGACASSPF